MDNIFNLIWFFIILSIFLPMGQKRLLEARRILLIKSIEKKRKSRVITLIHRQETLSFLGIPISRYIGIEDAEQILSAIHLTPNNMPVDIIMHTPGGLVLASEQIAFALKRHKGKVTVFIPHYAMSGGTFIALAADNIVMSQNAVLGAIDPQLGDPQTGAFPAVSILKALKTANPNRDDKTLIYGDIAQKAQNQIYEATQNLLLKHFSKNKAVKIAQILTSGRRTHDYPIFVEELKVIGLPVSDKIPEEIYSLMKLYPKEKYASRGVEFIPAPYRPEPEKPKKNE
ncbi:MAG: hypothetical protein NUV69_01945 [Candidatus Curtissbacteria bacterium]|nr:hypothetical protein [Candidatus Curtissbacteria bacterium]